MVIVLFGVTGSGKTTIGKLLAEDQDWRFVDADDYHSPANIEKMAAGIALGDDDRREWLDKLRGVIEEAAMEQKNIVLACSALKTVYRDQLAVSDDVKFVLLEANFDTVRKRLATRKGHFMDPKLIPSQFEILEARNRVDLVVDASLSPVVCVARIRRVLLEH